MTRRERDSFELEELAVQPGTYFNPQTEVAIVVDDSVALDPETFHVGAEAEAEWVRVSDEVPLDEHRRDELFEDFQAQRNPETSSEDFEEVDEIEPDPDIDDEGTGESEPELGASGGQDQY